jgi:purine-binding chemotaxis protein CheW
MGSLIPGIAQADAHRSSDKYLTFTLAGEAFGVAIEQVREIIEYRPPTVVPMVPDYLRGVLNLRGAVVPVVDLARRFGNAISPVGRRTCIVIVELSMWDGATQSRQILGVMVDAVNAVQDIPSTAIEPPPSFGTHIHADYLQGMGKVKERFVLILNLQRVLSEEELKVVQRTGGTATDVVVEEVPVPMRTDRPVNAAGTAA